MGNETGTMWSSKSTYVDIDSGEVLTKQQGQSEKYIILKTIKKIKINERKTKGHIEYTVQCRRNPQTELFNN